MMLNEKYPAEYWIIGQIRLRLQELTLPFDATGEGDINSQIGRLNLLSYLAQKYITDGNLPQASMFVEIIVLFNHQNAVVNQRYNSILSYLSVAYHERGRQYNLERKYPQEIAVYQSAIQLNPQYLPASNDLAWLLACCPESEFRNGSKSVDLASQICELTDWKNYVYLATLAAAYAETGNFDSAVIWLQNAIELIPENVSDTLRVKYDAPLILYQSDQNYPYESIEKYFYQQGIDARFNGEYATAIFNYEIALRYKPENELFLNTLARLYATCPVNEVRDGAKAVEYAIRLCELTNSKSNKYLDTLAAAYAEIHDFAKAVEWQKNAIELSKYDDKKRAEFENRKKLYRSGQPYREKQ